MEKLIVANWKINPQKASAAVALAKSIVLAKPPKDRIVVVCPSFGHLAVCAPIFKNKKGFALGAQDVFWEAQGAYTGEVSPAMLKSLGVEYVIVGHSERRRFLGETDEMVNKKVHAALSAGLKVILCVGEPREVRRQGFNLARRFVKHQIERALTGVNGKKIKPGFLSVAYEPIWAIGSGVPDRPEDSAAMASYIDMVVSGAFAIKKIAVLYGGSVNAKNAKSFLERPEIGGALVGGASLKPEEFKKIISL